MLTSWDSVYHKSVKLWWYVLMLLWTFLTISSSSRICCAIISVLLTFLTPVGQDSSLTRLNSFDKAHCFIRAFFFCLSKPKISLSCFRDNFWTPKDFASVLLNCTLGHMARHPIARLQFMPGGWERRDPCLWICLTNMAPLCPFFSKTCVDITFLGMKCLNNGVTTCTMLLPMTPFKVSLFFVFTGVILFVVFGIVDRVVDFIMHLTEERRKKWIILSSCFCLKKEERRALERKAGCGAVWFLIHSLYLVSTLCCVFASPTRQHNTTQSNTFPGECCDVYFPQTW